jgi:hypothetical protein
LNQAAQHLARPSNASDRLLNVCQVLVRLASLGAALFQQKVGCEFIRMANT